MATTQHHLLTETLDQAEQISDSLFAAEPPGPLKVALGLLTNQIRLSRKRALQVLRDRAELDQLPL
jgi:hypothetical protein